MAALANKNGIKVPTQNNETSRKIYKLWSSYSLRLRPICAILLKTRASASPTLRPNMPRATPLSMQQHEMLLGWFTQNIQFPYPTCEVKSSLASVGLLARSLVPTHLPSSDQLGRSPHDRCAGCPGAETKEAERPKPVQHFETCSALEGNSAFFGIRSVL